jgi:hypothetical protein
VHSEGQKIVSRPSKPALRASILLKKAVLPPLSEVSMNC